MDGRPDLANRWRSGWLPPFFKRNSASSASTLVDADPSSIPKWSFGVLNPHTTTDVPGTIQLLSPREPTQSSQPASNGESSTSLKTTPNGTIILNPQPSHSPNDPLNWPRWRRDFALVALGLYCSVGGGMPSLLAAGFNDVAQTYSVPVHRVALTTGLLMLGVGAGAVFAGPTAIIYGKRPVYLASVVLFLVATAWCALSPNFASLLVARVVQGIAISPVEALPSPTIAEMFFLHERSFRIGVYTLMLLGGKNLVPLISAAVIERMDWRWVFWVVAMAGAFCGLLLFIFMHETSWDRKLTLEELVVRDVAVGTAPKLDETRTPGNALASNDSPSGSSSVMLSTPQIPSPPPTPADLLEDTAMAYTHHRLNSPALPFAAYLRPFQGRILPPSRYHWHYIAARPFLLFLYPSILYSAFLYACSLGWLVVISESVAVIYRTRSFYNFNALMTGLVYLSPFIGGILGSAVAGWVSDRAVRMMAKRNGGVYEPEFRLVMIIPVTVCTVGGLIGFGWSAGVGNVWIVPTMWFGLVSFGCALGSTTAITFCVDSYKQFAGEALVTLTFSKNVFHGMVFSLFVTGWVESDGPRTVYLWIGIIQMVVLLFTIPMFLFGKRARLWTAGERFVGSKFVIMRGV